MSSELTGNTTLPPQDEFQPPSAGGNTIRAWRPHYEVITLTTIPERQGKYLVIYDGSKVVYERFFTPVEIENLITLLTKEG